MTSFGRQFDFHDVIFHKQHCNVNNRRRNVVLQLLDVENLRKNTRFSLNKSCGKFRQSVQDGGIVIDYEGFVHIFNLFVCFNRNKFALAVIFCLIYHCLSVCRKWINHSRFALMIYSL